MLTILLAVLVGTTVGSVEQVVNQFQSSYTTSTCPCPIYSEVLQPVYFTQHLTTSSVIRPFPESDPLTISSWPTNIQLSSTLTSVLTGCAQPITSTVTSVTPPSSTTANPSSLYIGQGLPVGLQRSLSDFIFIAYQPATTVSPVKRHLQPRQAASTSSIKAVNLAQATGSPTSAGQNNCDDASPLLLQDGRLIQYDNSVAKQVGEIAPLLGFIIPPPANEVNATFLVENGYLSWIAQDLNIISTWLVCNNGLYANFGPAPMGCTPVSVGLIAGSACIQRVLSSRAANPTFVAPFPVRRTSALTTPSLISTAGQSSPTTVTTSTFPSTISSLSTNMQASVVSSSSMSTTTGGLGMTSSTSSSFSQTSQSQSTFTGSTMSTLSTTVRAFTSSSATALSSLTPSSSTAALSSLTSSLSTAAPSSMGSSLSSEAVTSPSSLGTSTSTTVSAISSPTACIAPGSTSFKIRVSQPGGPYDGMFAVASDNTQTEGAINLIGNNQVPSIFSLNSAGNLLVNDPTNKFNGYLASTIVTNEPYQTVVLDSPHGTPLLVCSYDTNCQLSCSAGLDTVLEVCGGYLRMSTQATAGTGDFCSGSATFIVVDPAAS